MDKVCMAQPYDAVFLGMSLGPADRCGLEVLSFSNTWYPILDMDYGLSLLFQANFPAWNISREVLFAVGNRNICHWATYGISPTGQTMAPLGHFRPGKWHEVGFLEPICPTYLVGDLNWACTSMESMELSQTHGMYQGKVYPVVQPSNNIDVSSKLHECVDRVGLSWGQEIPGDFLVQPKEGEGWGDNGLQWSITTQSL